MFSYSKGYYVSPPDDQYLKFKNRCSLVHNLVWKFVHLFEQGERLGSVDPWRYTGGPIIFRNNVY